MIIKLTNLGKRYNREWIFRNFSFQFAINKHYAITGPNGSGKSTLLQIIAGSVIFNEGEIVYHHFNKIIEPEKIFRKISFAAPYLDLVEEMTLSEFFNFHHKMKSWISPLDTKKIILLSGLEKSAHKQIRYFSSGMKQRVKLALAVFSNAPVVLLDEPTTNLDEAGIELYHQLIREHCKEKLLIVSSNDKQEYGFCDKVLDMLELKKTIP